MVKKRDLHRNSPEKKLFLRAKEVQKILERYVPNPTIPLYHKDAFTLLIAVLLSAQCTDERVNIVTPPLFERASTPKEMARLSIDDIIAYIRSCGLYQVKAKNILELSKILVTRYEGQVPETLKELESLPGVGHKTASVVMAQAFKKPAFPVDTHILRSAVRWGLSQGKTVEQVERDLTALYPEEMWSKLHLQIILYARRFCPARGHKISECPVCSRLQKLEKNFGDTLEDT